MSVYGNNVEMLEDHGFRFVIILYYLSKGIRNNPVDSDRVYHHLGMTAFDQQLGREELVQFLEEQRLIEYDRNNNAVRLTVTGLEWARRHRDDPVYLGYRHLQN